jgi:hypothetical protein
MQLLRELWGLQVLRSPQPLTGISRVTIFYNFIIIFYNFKNHGATHIGCNVQIRRHCWVNSGKYMLWCNSYPYQKQSVSISLESSFATLPGHTHAVPAF